MLRTHSQTSADLANGATVTANGTTVTATDTTATDAENQATKKKRCVRLDIRHHRNIFFSMFYRIWMYRKRHIFHTLLQILFPPVILAGMIFYLGTFLVTRDNTLTTWPSVSEKNLTDKIFDADCDGIGIITIFMEHNNTKFAKKLQENLQTAFQSSNIQLESVAKKDDIARKAIEYHLKNEFCKYIGGIEILNPDYDDPVGQHGIGKDFVLTFTIVMAQKLPELAFKHKITFFDLDNHKPEKYYQFLGIEITVLQAFRNMTLERNPSGKRVHSVQVQSIPYPAYRSYSLIDDPTADVDEELDPMLASLLVLSLFPVFLTVVEGPVTEKENGFKLYLYLMGYPRAAYWFTWILNQMLVQFIVICLQLWILFSDLNPQTGPLIKNGEWTLWFVVLMLFNMSSLSFFVFIASFFRRAKMATYIGILIWLLSFYLLEHYLPAFGFGSELSSFLMWCIVPNGCIFWAVLILTTATSHKWAPNFQFVLTPKSGFNLSDVMAMMVAEFFLYFILTLYVDNLMPGPLEYSQPWNYFFEGIRCRYIDPNKDPDYASPSNVDQGSSTEIAIEFKNISKKFYLIDGVYGIENVSFTVHRSRITVLLGHHDSGRTTLMRLVCCQYAPTAGTVLVFGYNVRKDAQKVQSYLSVCMEIDKLCEYLTVMEHMQLVGKLKGLTLVEARKKAKVILDSVGLLSQAHDKMWQLVNWQRRVLCVAMALIGNSKILILDEPTKGLDLDAKRLVWAVLKDLKATGKTILMSTSDIKEAYQIADRIVIMSRGRVAGVGSADRLEKIFEIGYHLHIDAISNSNKEEILTFLQTHIPSAQVSEGALSKVDKAINFSDWDQTSQHCIVELHHRQSSLNPDTAINIAEPPMAKVIELMNPNVRPQESSSVIIKANEQTGSASHSFEYVFVLPNGTKGDFPKLFAALDNQSLQLGIKKYDLRLHDIEKAFDEVDDYVEVWKASKSKQDLETADFADIKILKVPNSHSVSRFPLPAARRQLLISPEICSGFNNLWALIIKRVYFILGNYRHTSIQVITPIFILLLLIGITNVHFRHDLFTHEIAYTSLMKSTTSIAPVRIQHNPGENAKKLFESFKKIVNRAPDLVNVKEIGTLTFEHYYDEHNRYKLHNEVKIGADFTNMDNKEPEVIAMFSSGSHHSSPMSLLQMFNSILDFEFPDENYRVKMNARGMSSDREYVFLDESRFPKILTETGVDVTFVVFLAFGFFIFSCGFVTEPCAENIAKLKRFQMNAITWNMLYWLGNAAVDLVLNIFVVISLTLTIYYYPSHGVFATKEFLILFIWTGLLGGFSSIITSYFWSNYLLRTSTSYYATLSIFQFVGLFGFLLYTIINFDYIGYYASTVTSLSLQMLHPFAMSWNFYLAVSWALQNGRCAMLNPIVKEEMCKSTADKYPNIADIRQNCCENTPQTWSLQFILNEPQLWISLTILFSHCVVHFLLLVFIERRKVNKRVFQLLQPEKPYQLKDPKDLESVKKEEEEVEKAMVLNRAGNRKYFIVHNLGTCSGRRNLLHGISFVAEPGKCVVVVGPETSGVSVLYEVIAGIRAKSHGDVSYSKDSLFSWISRPNFLYQVGYCPTQDICVDSLSGLQLLKLFGRLRGIPSNSLQAHVDYWVLALGLQKMINKLCKSYSVVIRRKLAVAVAAIGNPPVVICDDPTANLDPVSRVQVCSVLECLVAANRTVILMTHDVSAFANICNKLIILVNGQMHFCGDPEMVFKDIAHEFVLIIRLREDESVKIGFKTYSDLKTNLEKEIDSMTLQNEELHCLTYRINNKEYQWSNLFEKVQKVTDNYSEIIQDFYIRRASLEDIYSSYAVKQRVLRKTESTWEKFCTTYC